MIRLAVCAGLLWAAYRAGQATALGKSFVDSWTHPLTDVADLAVTSAPSKLGPAAARDLLNNIRAGRS